MIYPMVRCCVLDVNERKEQRMKTPSLWRTRRGTRRGEVRLRREVTFAFGEGEFAERLLAQLRRMRAAGNLGRLA